MFDILLMLVGCAALYFGGDWLIRGCTGVGTRLGLPPLLVGLVLVAFGTSAPELAVSVDAAIRGHGDLALGNVVGSNVVNSILALLVLVSAARMPSGHSLASRDVPFLLLLTALTALVLTDGSLGRWEGAGLLTLAAAFIAFVLKSTTSPLPDSAVANPSRQIVPPLWKPALLAAGGVGMLVVGAEAMVRSGIAIALALGVSEVTIALTVTAVGTGIPEISATLVALLRGHGLIAIGNLVGSNVMNFGFVLGLAASLAPVQANDLTVMPLLLLVLVLMTLLIWLLLSRFPTVMRLLQRQDPNPESGAGRD